MTEHQLVQAARGGDAGAARALYTEHAPRVYAVARRILNDETLAQDAAQDAWVRALRGLDGFRRDSRFGTWLHRIAVNSALHHLRKRARVGAREVPVPLALVGSSGSDALLALQLERALAALPERMRTVIVLHDVEGFTHEEIGEMLGVTSGTSKSQLFKARAKMRAMLAPREARADTDIYDRVGERR